MKYDDMFPSAPPDFVSEEFGLAKSPVDSKCESCGQKTAWVDTLVGIFICSEECSAEWYMRLENEMDEIDSEWDELLGL